MRVVEFHDLGPAVRAVAPGVRFLRGLRHLVGVVDLSGLRPRHVPSVRRPARLLADPRDGRDSLHRTGAARFTTNHCTRIGC